MADARGRATPDLPAWVDGEERVSWAEFGARVDAFALALADLGLRPGDVAAIMGQTCGAWAGSELAVLSAGGGSGRAAAGATRPRGGGEGWGVVPGAG